MRVIALVLVMAFAATAHAEDRALAERYFRLGEKAYQQQDFAAAATNFEEAYKQFAIPEIAFSAAQAYRRQYRIDGKPERVKRAVDLYRAYLAKVKSGGRVADAADALAEMQQELDKLISSGIKVSPELAKEHTRIVVNPTLGKEAAGRGMQEVVDSERKEETSLTARVDGAEVTPFAPLNVAPGKHQVDVEAQGFFPVRVDAVVPQGATKIVDVVLEPRPAKVTVRTEPDARIAVDGRFIGTAPLATLDIPAGRHVLTITRRGRQPIARELAVTRGQAMTLDAPLEHTGRRKAVPWLLVGAGAAAAFTVASTVVAVRNDNRAYDLYHLDFRTSGNATAAELEAYRDAVRWRDRGVTGIWIGGAAMLGLAGIAAVLYYTDNPGADGVRVEPVVSAGGAGATIAGRF